MVLSYRADSCNGEAVFYNLCNNKPVLNLTEGYLFVLTIDQTGKLKAIRWQHYTKNLVYFIIENPNRFNLFIYGYDHGNEYVWHELKDTEQTGKYFVPWCTTDGSDSFIEIQVDVEPPCEGICPGYCPSGEVCLKTNSEFSCYPAPCTTCGGTCNGSCPEGETCEIDPDGNYSCVACQECSGSCKGPCPEGQECQLISGEYTCVQKCTSCSGSCLGPCPEGQECQLVSGQYTCVGQDLCGCPSGEKCVINSDGDYICEKEKTKFPWWGWLLISLGILIVLLILGFIIYKITRNKNTPEV